MAALGLAQRRLLSQRLIGARSKTPAEVVRWLVAVQAQDYAGAKWAVGLRLPGSTEDMIEQAFASGAILRTHLLRPTWHFITPDDFRWVLTLTAPHVHAASARMYRKLGLDAATLRRSHIALANALQGGRHLTRTELRTVLTRVGIRTDDLQRMTYLMLHAELDGVICSGPRRGKQFTYALFDERVPPAKAVGRGDALTELARRFFSSRGPATVQDFAKWSGLNAADAQAGLEGASRKLESEGIERRTYWFARSKRSALPDPWPIVHLLSIYDEYISGYKDRAAMIDPGHAPRLSGQGSALSYIVVVNGQVVGTWKRRADRRAVVIGFDLFEPLTKAQRRALRAAVREYGAFHRLSIVVER